MERKRTLVRTVDYESRRRAVLTVTINRYIQDAFPVSSEDVAADFDLSSATIRNIFAELEGAGLLTHPYTSGGRIPTEKGYRYYVDFLISQMELVEEEKEHILKEYQREIQKLEDLLEETSEVISRITHYAGFVSLFQWQDKFFYKGLDSLLSQPEFQDLERMRLLIRTIEEKQRLLGVINRDFSGRVKVYIGEELDCPEIGKCSLVVSSYKVKERPLGRLAVLGPMRMEYRHIIPTLEYVSQILSETLDKI